MEYFIHKSPKATFFFLLLLLLEKINWVLCLKSEIAKRDKQIGQEIASDGQDKEVEKILEFFLR